MEAKGKTHDRARGGTTVLQSQKGGTAVSPTVRWRMATCTVVRVTVRPPTAGRAGRRAFAIYPVFRLILRDSFGWGFKSSSIKVSLPHSQTPLGGNKLGIRLD